MFDLCSVVASLVCFQLNGHLTLTNRKNILDVRYKEKIPSKQLLLDRVISVALCKSLSR
jgi:hypothetical protein